MAVQSLYHADNPVYASFCFYSALVSLKMLLMALLTARQRIAKKAFANPEDAVTLKIKVKVDDDVERVRRAHLNDLENILPFLILAFIYVGINPSFSVAVLAFRVFTIARFLHTLVYAVFVIPQPARALAFFAGMAVNVFMAVSIILYYSSAM